MLYKVVCGNVGLSFYYFGLDYLMISHEIYYRYAQRLNYDGFGDPITFILASPLRQTFNGSNTLLCYLTNYIPISLGCTLCELLMDRMQ